MRTGFSILAVGFSLVASSASADGTAPLVIWSCPAAGNPAAAEVLRAARDQALAAARATWLGPVLGAEEYRAALGPEAAQLRTYEICPTDDELRARLVSHRPAQLVLAIYADDTTHLQLQLRSVVTGDLLEAQAVPVGEREQVPKAVGVAVTAMLQRTPAPVRLRLEGDAPGAGTLSAAYAPAVASFGVVGAGDVPKRKVEPPWEVELPTPGTYSLVMQADEEFYGRTLSLHVGQATTVSVERTRREAAPAEGGPLQVDWVVAGPGGGFAFWDGAAGASALAISVATLSTSRWYVSPVRTTMVITMPHGEATAFTLGAGAGWVRPLAANREHELRIGGTGMAAFCLSGASNWAEAAQRWTGGLGAEIGWFFRDVDDSGLIISATVALLLLPFGSTRDRVFLLPVTLGVGYQTTPGAP